MPKFVPVEDDETPREERIAQRNRKTDHPTVDRGWEQGQVGWGVRGAFGSSHKDEGAQRSSLHTSKRDDFKMEKNEKGLWVKVKRKDISNDPTHPKGRGRGRGISVIEDALQVGRMEQTLSGSINTEQADIRSYDPDDYVSISKQRVINDRGPTKNVDSGSISTSRNYTDSQRQRNLSRSRSNSRHRHRRHRPRSASSSAERYRPRDKARSRARDRRRHRHHKRSRSRSNSRHRHHYKSRRSSSRSRSRSDENRSRRRDYHSRGNDQKILPSREDADQIAAAAAASEVCGSDTPITFSFTAVQIVERFLEVTLNMREILKRFICYYLLGVWVTFEAKNR